MTIDYKVRSKEWYDRALAEKDDFVKFILLFISLEVSRKIRNQTIRSMGQDKEIRTAFFGMIPTDRINLLKEALDKEPLRNMNPNGDLRWSGTLADECDFAGLIEFIISARNNLFHGDKGLDSTRDQFIVNWGNFLLVPLVRASLS